MAIGKTIGAAIIAALASGAAQAQTTSPGPSSTFGPISAFLGGELTYAFK